MYFVETHRISVLQGLSSLGARPGDSFGAGGVLWPKWERRLGLKGLNTG